MAHQAPRLQAGLKTLIRGDGIAAYCCAHLLSAAGASVFMERTDRNRVPVILLSESTQALIGDIFGRSDLFSGLPTIEKRIVAWGPDSKAIVLPHSSVIISEADLAERLRPLGLIQNPDQEWKPDWTVLASRPLHSTAVEHSFGSRVAEAVRVDLLPHADSGACWIESMEAGWVFLIPGADKTGWLLSVGGGHERLLPQSRLVAMQVQRVNRREGNFPAYPRISDPLCGHTWLGCGSAALTFDPLCGDGTGNAIREAILAAAVIRAAALQGDENHLLAHYRGRLLAGFRRHLELCRQFYQQGNSGPWWKSELELLSVGLEWCAREIQDQAPYRFRLNGFELEPLANYGPG